MHGKGIPAMVLDVIDLPSAIAPMGGIDSICDFALSTRNMMSANFSHPIAMATAACALECASVAAARGAGA